MWDRKSSLHCAVRTGDFGQVKDLVEQGVNISVKDEYGRTALIYAVKYGRLDVIKYLVEQGAKDDRALIYAALCGKLDVVEYLVEQGANDGGTALIHAAGGGKLDVVKCLVKQGANLEATDMYSRRTALTYAAENGKLDVVKYLVEQGANIEATDNNDRTALIYAARLGKLGVVKYLVKQGANKEATGEVGGTALIRAARVGKVGVVKYLAERGANEEATDEVTKETSNNDGGTALIHAKRGGNLDVVDYLFEQGARDKDGKTVLMQAASQGVLKKVKHLVGRGDDSEVKDNDGRTALMYAAMHGRLDVVKYFVGQGADASCVDNDGNSLLHHLLAFTDRTWRAIWISRRSLSDEDTLPIAKLLLDHGMPLDSNHAGESARSIAKSRNFLQLARLLKEHESKRMVEAILKEEALRRRPEPEEEVPSWTISPDEIAMQSLLAEGGYGIVCRATWKGAVVVVKTITVVEMRKFLKEVKTWHKLNHPNIVRFYRANYKTEPYFIVSEYASNGELVSYLKREKAHGRTVVWQKLYEVAVGLSYLHEEKLVHGDLKGNNVVVSKDGTAMLTDFGLTFSEDGSCSLASKKDTLGAMAWRAPEFAILDSKIRPTQKSDVYSLGMCIVEAVTCEKPWGAYSNEEIREFLRRGEIKVEKPSEMSGEQWQLVQRMTAVRPDDRPDVDEVLPGLKRFADAERDAEFKADQRKRCPF